YALAVTTRHPSPTALKNLFTAVCNATSCPRTIITITTDQLTARTRRKSGSFTRKRSLPAVDLSSRLSRRIIASFLPHCLSLLPSPLWCYRTLNFLPLPLRGRGNQTGHDRLLVDIQSRTMRVENLHRHTSPKFRTRWQGYPMEQILLCVLPWAGATVGGAWGYPGSTAMQALGTKAIPTSGPGVRWEGG